MNQAIKNRLPAVLYLGGEMIDLACFWTRLGLSGAGRGSEAGWYRHRMVLAASPILWRG